MRRCRGRARPSARGKAGQRTSNDAARQVVNQNLHLFGRAIAGWAPVAILVPDHPRMALS
ncbi:hypothetical protein PAMC26510_03400 [Caballeronia sordidicola]|uniref:Uncharacterized protein n=1 Tax=Caballeronia sordidicola TaxID=196367 RepID=A0A242N973_CABSO|nr:hypothetical protein PAMC26510_03400 [Caballeronia sordidicola]